MPRDQPPHAPAAKPSPTRWTAGIPSNSESKQTLPPFHSLCHCLGQEEPVLSPHPIRGSGARSKGGWGLLKVSLGNVAGRGWQQVAQIFDNPVPDTGLAGRAQTLAPSHLPEYLLTSTVPSIMPQGSHLRHCLTGSRLNQVTRTRPLH